MVLPVLGFPKEHHATVQRCIDSADKLMMPGTESSTDFTRVISEQMRVQLGEARHAVEHWLQSFPFTAESVHPELYYWSSRFDDMLSVDISPAPAGIDEDAWHALIEAYRGRKPARATSLDSALVEAAQARRAVFDANDVIDSVRGQPLSRHDLDIYMRFGWNDHGTHQGLSSLQIGAKHAGTQRFWKAVAQHFPALPFETLAYERDMAAWNVAANPTAFAKDATRYGVSAEQMAADIFPKPEQPPPLSALLQG